MKEGVCSRCPCVAVVYTPVRQRGCLTLKEREDAQTVTVEQHSLPGAAPPCPSSSGTAKELPVAPFLKQDKVTREKMLRGQSASAWEEAPEAASVLAPQCPSGQLCKPQ